MRHCELTRTTKETDIQLLFALDGSANVEVNTGIGFFDHMLTLFASHGLFDLKIHAKGDIHVDFHHTVEDVGIVLGKAVAHALGDMKGVKRYGKASVPMEESLAHVFLDICKRPYLVFNAIFPTHKVGDFDLELVEEFFRAVAVNAGLTLHIKLEYGKNAHHMAEAIFKAFGRALEDATRIDSRLQNTVMSTKGTL